MESDSNNEFFITGKITPKQISNIISTINSISQNIIILILLVLNPNFLFWSNKRKGPHHWQNNKIRLYIPYECDFLDLIFFRKRKQNKISFNVWKISKTNKYRLYCFGLALVIYDWFSCFEEFQVKMLSCVDGPKTITIITYAAIYRFE